MTYRMWSRSTAVTAALCMTLAATARSEIIEQVLVKVNGEIFTKSDLETKQIQAIRERGKQIDLNTEQGNAELRKTIAEITPALLVNLVDEMLVVQRGKELGYKLSEEQFRSVLDNLKTQNKIENEEQLLAALKQENMTMADLRRSLERQMIATRVQQAEVFGRVAITEDEARKYYDGHLNEFTTPSTIMLREILIAVPVDSRGVNVGADEAAKSRAEEVRKRIVGGESFEKVAAEVSDAPSKANGGLIGPLNVNDLSTDFRKLVDTMKVGGLTDVVRTQRGYQVLKLESSTPTQVMPFEQAREQISERVVTGKRLEELKKYLVKLRSQAIIDWKNPDVKKAYDEGLAAQAKAGAGPSQ
jgi:peptidyl-prolyl cis-trans isomerase SurA